MVFRARGSLSGAVRSGSMVVRARGSFLGAAWSELLAIRARGSLQVLSEQEKNLSLSLSDEIKGEEEEGATPPNREKERREEKIMARALTKSHQ